MFKDHLDFTGEFTSHCQPLGLSGQLQRGTIDRVAQMTNTFSVSWFWRLEVRVGVW